MLKLQKYDVHMLYNFFTFGSTQVNKVVGPIVRAQTHNKQDMVCREHKHATFFSTTYVSLFKLDVQFWIVYINVMSDQLNCLLGGHIIVLIWQIVVAAADICHLYSQSRKYFA